MAVSRTDRFAREIGNAAQDVGVNGLRGLAAGSARAGQYAIGVPAAVAVTAVPAYYAGRGVVEMLPRAVDNFQEAVQLRGRIGTADAVIAGALQTLGVAGSGVTALALSLGTAYVAAKVISTQN